MNTQLLEQIKDETLSKFKVKSNLAPPSTTFNSSGNVLLIGPEDLTRLAMQQLSNHSGQRAILVNGQMSNLDDIYLATVVTAANDVPISHNKFKSISGYLGQFQVLVDLDGQDVELAPVLIRKAFFDLVIDLSVNPCINLDKLPAGYFYVGSDKKLQQNIIDELRQYIGSFNKPRYVSVDNDICAHFSSGVKGCQRCLSSCPADAISSINNQIIIDENICHGVGSCAAVCPTEAIKYDTPTAKSLHEHLHEMLSFYVTKAKVNPVLIISETENELPVLDAITIPLVVDELTVLGIEHWLTAITSGAREILLVTSSNTVKLVKDTLNSKIALLNSIFDAIGQPHRVKVVDDIALIPQLCESSSGWPLMPITKLSSQNKNSIFYAAIDYLNNHSGKIKSTLQIYDIPYGTVSVNTEKCTLCMSCAALCPTLALTDGGDLPQLSFTESNCIQCGLCVGACPEKVINLTSQINFDPSLRLKKVLKEEKPFHCISCNQIFATESVIKKMESLIGGHSAFSANVQRLRMCGDCRVKDALESMIEDPEQQLR